MRVEKIRLETAMRTEAGVSVLGVSGEIDVFTAPEFKSAINQTIESGLSDLIIDLTRVSYMDSSGFGTLLGATKRVRPKGGSVNLVGCNEAIERMMKITRLDTVFNLCRTVEEAAARIGKSQKSPASSTPPSSSSSGR